MQIYRSLAEIPTGYGPTVVTIGNFDGVHRGHLAVIRDVLERARALHAHPVAVTFDPHPVRVLRPDVPLQLITPLEEKLALLGRAGLETALVLPFTPQFSSLTGREFAQQVLVESLHAIEVQEGENFRFGIGAQDDIHTLAEYGRELGFLARVHQPTLDHGVIVSSSAVRAAVAGGDMRTARHLLGRPFSLVSTPAPGRGYGSRYTVPTINLAPYPELTPAAGVYITCLEIAGERFQSVTNIGMRPTFENASFAIETHILDFHPLALDAGMQLRLNFLDRLREERTWHTPEALKQQIGRDVARARHYFSLYRSFVSQSV